MRTSSPLFPCSTLPFSPTQTSLGIRFLSDEFCIFLHKSISSSSTYLPSLAQRPVEVSTLITGLETNLFHGPNLYASLDVFLAIFLISPQDTKMPFTFVRSFDPGGRGQVPGQTHSWVLHKFRCGQERPHIRSSERTSCLGQDTSRVEVARLKTCVVTSTD